MSSPYTVSRYLRDVAPEHWQPEDLAWHDLALCAETDPEAFFPEKGGSTREAKQVCRSCEVRAECLEYALEHGDEPWARYGIWGGMSERERRRLRHFARRPAADVIAETDARRDAAADRLAGHARNTGRASAATLRAGHAADVSAVLNPEPSPVPQPQEAAAA